MKKLVLLLFVGFISTQSFGQDLVMKTQLFSGGLNGFYQKVENMVINVDGSGAISEVLVFDSASQADQFLLQPALQNRPTFQVAVGDVPLFISSIGAVQCYTPNEFNSGEIKEISGLAVEYFSPNEYNEGKVKRIGSLQLEYYTPQEYNDGRLKQIGSIEIQYRTPQEYNEGKLKKVGAVEIEFYTPQEYNDGKLKRVGDIKLSYFTPQEYNSGNLKEVQGSDARVRFL